MRHPLLKWAVRVGVLTVLLVVIAVIAFPALFGIGKTSGSSADEADVKGTATVVTAAPTAGALSPVARAYGVVASSPQRTLIITSLHDGIFKSVSVREGETVRVGQPIATVTAAPATTAQFAQVRSALDFATQDLARVQRLFANKLATNDQLATARKALSDAQVQFDQQRNIGAGLAEEVLRAPADGVITGLMAIPGDKALANVPIATLVSRSDVVVQINLEPEDASKLSAGAPVRLTTSFQDANEISGQITSISGIVDPTSHLVKAFVQIPAAAAVHLALGVTLLAQIDLPSRQGILVPRSALLEDAGGSHVFTVSQGAAHRQDIKVLVETDDMALIEGLVPALGTQVVVSGNAELDDDTPVVEAKP